MTEDKLLKFPLIKMAGRDFKNRLKKIKPFMCNQETRHYLCGIYLEYDHSTQQLTMVATNGHILQEQIFDVEADLSEAYRKFNTIIPATAVADLIKIMPAEKESNFTFQLIEGGKYARFDFFESEYTTAVIDGMFPDYNKVIPKGSTMLKSGLNAGYLIDALKALGNEAVNIAVDSDDQAPHLLTSDSATGMKCVVMPKVAFGVEDEKVKEKNKEKKKKKNAA